MGFIDNKGIAIPLSATLVVQALVSMAAVAVPVFAPVAAEDIGVSATYVGIYVGVLYVSSMASSLWSGEFILRYGALRVSQMCLVFCAIGLALAAGGSVFSMIVCALIIGLGYGAVTPASSHILARHTPAHLMSFVFSLKQTGVPLGGAMAGAIVPPLVLFSDWKIASLIVGVSCVVLALLIQPSRPGIDADRLSGRRISFKGVTQPLKIVISHLPLLKLAIISFFFAGMQLCLITYLVIYLTGNVGMALITAGLVLSAGQAGGAVARIIWGIVADRYLEPWLLLGFLGIAMSLSAIATACFSPGWPYPAIWLVIILFGATAIGWNGVYLAEAARLAPKGQVGAATGGTLFFTYSGVVFGPPIFAAIVAKTDSYPWGFVIFAILAFFCGLAAILFKPELSVSNYKKG